MNNTLISVYSDNSSSSWNIFVDGYFKRNVENQMLRDDMSQESVNDIFSNASRILNKCPNPNIENDVVETGIVIGKVQSGKTSNFISVLALAFDNGYDISIVLGGNTLQLLKQNASRVGNAFNVDTEKMTLLTTNDNKSLINADRIKEFIENGRKIIIVGLKHYKHINKISEIFDNGYLAQKSVLIIDDEGDQATLNTKAFIKSMSSTYENVISLKSKLKSHCFLSITATPQANTLIDVFDKLSPDFGELVYPGEGYCGLQEFHGEDCEKYIYEIPANEGDLLDDVGVPKSVYSAMALFFVGNAIRRSRGDQGNHAMLIHPSRKKFDHQTVVSKIQSILDDWKAKAKIKLSGRNDLSYSSLKNLLIVAYKHFCLNGVITVSFDELELPILNIIKQCSPVHICNSDENASDNSKLYKSNIFVGGNLVERGITIKGLAVTYITRRAKGKSNVDNTEQRARWFGYKASYLDVCRVFATKDIKDDFSSILEHDEDMWASIERARDRGIAFKDMPRIFKLSRNAFLTLTRTNVARAKQYELSEWKPQKKFIFDKEMALCNKNLIDEFRRNFTDIVEFEQHNPVQIHAIIRNLNFIDVCENLLLHLKYTDGEVLNKEFFKTLNAALKKLELYPDIDILWMRDFKHQKRKINQDGTIQQLFQGRNPNISSSLYYSGDRSLVDKFPDRMQLQIHYVIPTNIEEVDYYVPILAIYIPEKYSDSLSKLVVKSDE